MSRWPLIQILRKMSICKATPPSPKDSKCATYTCPGQTTYESRPDGGYKVYKNIFFLLCVPAILTATVSVFCGDHEVKRPKFVKYPYLRIRTKRFAWGDGVKTFFHNPSVNALPDGYEDDDDDDDDYDD